VLVASLPTVREGSSAAEAGEDASARFAAMFRSHYVRVRRWVQALGVTAEADDVAQEVFLIAHRRIDSLRADASVKAWLYGIARGVCENHRRGRAREQARRDRLASPAAVGDPEHAAGQRQGAALLQDFLEQLPDDQREAFVLYDIEGMSAPEVAEALGLAAELVHSRVRSAREKLRRFVERQKAIARRESDHG
jgi:RNA polymerase sigma-70 factor (ECF subfamily)